MRPQEQCKNVLTLSIRLHDPDEDKDPKLAASWATRKIPREDLKLSRADFIAKYITPALDELAHILHG
jgi:hypothetical protein